jgi:hypothetical protein
LLSRFLSAAGETVRLELHRSQTLSMTSYHERIMKVIALHCGPYRRVQLCVRLVIVCLLDGLLSNNSRNENYSCL